MKILVVGLGVIGGSYCLGLSKKHEVYGVDNNQETLDLALQKGCIERGETDASKLIPLVDLIVLAIYPSMIVPFIQNHTFKENQIITDVAGVKGSFIGQVKKVLPKNVEFVGTHPMAGKEKKGFCFADPNVFQNANFIITPIDNDGSAIEKVKTLASDLGFKKITVINPFHHDKMIAYTSQLTHAIAVSLVNSDKDNDTPLYTGDSYRDLTRIAKINEKLWSELFLENKDNLLEMIENFEVELNKVKKAIKDNDKEALEKMFIESTKRRGMFDEKNDSQCKEKL